MSSMKASRIIDVHSADSGKSPHAEPARKHPMEMIWHRKLIVLLTTAVCVGGAYALYNYMTPLYTSTSGIQIESPQGKLPGVSGDSSPVPNNLYTQAKVVTSTAVLADALGRIKEKWDDELEAGRARVEALEKQFAQRAETDADPQLKNIDAELTAAKHDLATVAAAYNHFNRETNHLAALKNGVRTAVGEKDDILTVAFDSPFPKEAQLIVAAVVETYKRFSSSEKHNTAKDTIDKIDSDRQKWQQEVDSRRDKVLDLQAQIDRLQVKSVTAESEQKLKMLSEALAAAELESINAQSSYEDFARSAIKDLDKLNLLLNSGRYNGMAINVGGDERTLQQEIHTAQHSLSELQQRYLPNHPAVQSAKSRLDELNAQYVLFLHQKWVSAKNKMVTLDERYQAQKKASRQRDEDVQAELRRKTFEYDQQAASLKNTQDLMNSLVTRAQGLKIGDDFGQVTVKVLEPANLPTSPTRPVKATMLFEGLIVGLILGVSLTFLDQRLRSVEEIAAASGLPVLGVIPHMPRSGSTASRGRKVHLDPMSDVSEAYRTIRTAIYFGPRGAKTILVTSPTRGEGKSTLASNLAIAMAEAGQKVLLMDADLRDPTQHRIFATSNEAGLSTIVAGRSSAERTTQSSQIKGLEILPCGPIPHNPSETINNQTFADMLQDMANKYDYVVVDSPPVMAVTDARILGAMCDLTVLVIRAEKTTRKSASDARDGLMGFGANLLGIVVNDGRRDRNRYGYYGGYGQARNGQSAGQKVAAQINGSSRSTALVASDLMLGHNDRR